MEQRIEPGEWYENTDENRKLLSSGDWCWVGWPTMAGDAFPAMYDPSACGHWSNQDTWEDFDRDITRFMLIPKPPAFTD